MRDLLNYDPESGVFTWRVARTTWINPGRVAGSLNAEGYRYIKVDGKNYKANRLAWFFVHGVWPDGQVDHINGDKADDRIANLRVCTNAENSQNRRRPAGAYRRPDGVFTSFVTVAGKRHYLGRFKTEELARAAYVEAKRRLHPFQNTGNLHP